MATEDHLPAPPYSLDVLSDLHAGALPESVCAQLWPRVRQDPEAMRVIDQLDALTMELAELGRDETVEKPIPDRVAAQLDAALTTASADASSNSNVVRFPRRYRTWATAAAGTAAAAAVAVVAAVIIPSTSTDNESTGNQTVALPSSTSQQEPGRMMTLLGSRDLGPLEEPAALSECLQANGIDASRPVLGSGQVRVQGRPGTAILLAGPHPPKITALVVGSDCSAGNPDLISRDVVG